MGAVQMQKVITLNQLIGEFGKRHAVCVFSGQPLFNRIFGHHIVYGDVLANVSYKLKKADVFHPIVIVYELCGVGPRGVKV